MGAAVGSMACRGLNCTREVPVTVTSGGTLSMRCGFCGFSAYAQKGTKSAREIQAAMKPEEGGESAATQPAAPAPATPSKKAAAFDLSQLRG